MFNVRWLLICDDWQERNIGISTNDLALAYVSAIRMIKQRTGIATLDFLPLGNDEYLIWGQKTCQGYMAIKEEPATVAAKGG